MNISPRNSLSDPNRRVTLGLANAFGAGLLWGLLPLYWYLLAAVNPMEVLAHRIFWAFVSITLFLMWRGKLFAAWRICTSSKRVMALLAISSLLISSNWLVYIWSIKYNHVLEASLGYFISPLMSVLIGALVLGEKMHKLQWLALAVVGASIAFQISHIGSFPWIALTLASTFAIYGLIKKVVVLDSVGALWFETMLAIVPAFFVVRNYLGTSNLVFADAASPLSLSVFLIGCGVVTLVPMLLFAEGTKRLNLSTMGFLHFVAPTLQFILAIAFFGDRPDYVRWLSFVCVWAAIILFLCGQWLQYKNRSRMRTVLASTGSDTLLGATLQR